MHGHGHGGVSSGLEERLLFDGSAEESAQLRAKEVSRAWFYRLLLMTCSLIETLVILGLMASNRDIFTEKYFNVRKDLRYAVILYSETGKFYLKGKFLCCSDVILITLLMGIFGTWLGFMINPKVGGVGEAAGSATSQETYSKLYISVMYWLCVSACILLVAKLIAFDMSFKDNLNMVFLSFLACIVQVGISWAKGIASSPRFPKLIA